MEKTNVERLLSQKKIEYVPHAYSDKDGIDGMTVAGKLGENPARVFKTLVTTGKSGAHYVFMVPVCCELDLKKAARAVREKSIEMLKAKELLPLTGYIHGGCSPIGMKKAFPTTLHESAVSFPTIFCSGGKIGAQIEVSPENLKKIVNYALADIVVE